jgi:hypothetical protein
MVAESSSFAILSKKNDQEPQNERKSQASAGRTFTHGFT